MNLDRLIRMHQMIQSESTGTPEEFAEVFQIKDRQLQYQIEELRLYGANIKYSRKRATYFYVTPFNFAEELDYLDLSRRLSVKGLKEILKNCLEKKTPKDAPNDM